MSIDVSFPEGPRREVALASIEEVSRYLNVPVATLRHWRRVGKGPRSIIVGRLLRYRWEDVEGYLDDLVTEQSDTSNCFHCGFPWEEETEEARPEGVWAHSSCTERWGRPEAA